MFYKYLILCFALYFTYVECTVFIKAPCPDIKPVENFNWKAYKGVWYEVARYPDDWEKKGDCGMMEYDVNSETNAFNLSNVVDKKRVSVLGTVKPEGGILNHYSSDFDKVEGTSVIPVNIIAVDYDKFAVIYECIYDEKTKTRHDFAWLMSRFKTPNEEVLKIIKDYINSSKILIADKLNWSHLTDEICLMN